MPQVRPIATFALVLAPSIGAAQGAPADTSRATLPPLHHEAAAFDPARGRLVVFAGSDSLKGTWEWDGRRWRLVADSASGPPHPRVGATLGYDPEGRRLVLFGGWGGVPRPGPGLALACDTWAFDGARWARVGDGACVTDRVRDNSLVYDARRRALLLLDGTPELPGQEPRPLRVWRWARNGWEPVDSAGPRRGGWEAAVYDEARGRVVLPVLDGPDAGVWEWDGARWAHLRASGPTARHSHALAYDARRRRVVLVGGQTVSHPVALLGDAWTWDGARWTALATPAGGAAPVPRSAATLVDDPTNGRLLYFGGWRGPPMRYLPELWILDDRGWREWRP